MFNLSNIIQFINDYLVNIGIFHYLMLSFFIVILGIFSIISSKNIIKVLISLEIMFCGVTLNFLTFAYFTDIQHFQGMYFAFFIIVLASIHLALGLIIALNIYKFKSSVNTEDMGDLKG